MLTHVLIHNYVFQILPDITSVIAKWQSLSKKEMTNDEEKNTPTEGSVTQTDDKNENPGTHTEHTSYVAFIDYS